jgi:hypothetical protein
LNADPDKNDVFVEPAMIRMEKKRINYKSYFNTCALLSGSA